jgi:NitT/TauT family transport system ATP-binding protein
MQQLEYSLGERLLSVQNVSLEIRRTVILRDVNVEVKNVHRPGVKQGQVIGFLGPSGIGKTRFFNILAGLEQLKHGSHITGSVLLGDPGVPVHAGMVGVVTQNYLTFERRTVLSNLIVAGMQAGNTRAEATERAYGMLERFKMADKATLYPSELSGGQRQRIAIAQQMLCDGHFLLMDEPFSGLDMIMKAEVARLINEIALMDEKNTIIVVTHDVTEAASVSDTLWLMGRDRDLEGKVIPGARIQQTYNLMERGLAWQQGITTTREFMDFTTEVKQRFMTL